MQHFISALIEDKILFQKIKFEFFIILRLVAFGTIIFWYVEWRSRFNSFYFCVTTLASLWFWDFVPQTVVWKIWSMFFATIGVPVFLYTTSIVLASRAKKFSRQIQKHIEEEIKKEIPAMIKKSSQAKKSIKKSTSLEKKPTSTPKTKKK